MQTRRQGSTRPRGSTMDSVNRDYYEVIGLSRNANQKEIDAACYRLAEKYRPERNPGDPLAAKNFALIDDVYETLGSPSRRATYDTTLQAPTDAAHLSNAKTADGSTATESGRQNVVSAFLVGGVAGVWVG